MLDRSQFAHLLIYYYFIYVPNMLDLFELWYKIPNAKNHGKQ